jgi:hypothetical protein
MSSRLAPGVRARRRPGPLLLLLPLALLLLGLLHLARREPVPAPAPPPDVTSPDETVAAWTGELEGGDGGWLVATLTPLHADARRQAFEASALQRELELGPGQPWRLSVRWERPRPSGAAAAAPAPGDRPERVPAAGIALGPVSVVDGEGTALVSLPAAGEPDPGAPVAPLRTLVSPPRGSLRAGQEADWILWGRAPQAGARLEGLVPPDDGLFLAATGFGGPIPLRTALLRRGDLGQPLARLERPPSGKSDGGAASESVDDGARNGHR